MMSAVAFLHALGLPVAPAFSLRLTREGEAKAGHAQ